MRCVAFGSLVGVWLTLKLALNTSSVLWPLALAMALLCFLSVSRRPYRRFCGAAIIGVLMAGAQLLALDGFENLLNRQGDHVYEITAHIESSYQKSVSAWRLKVKLLTIRQTSVSSLWPIYATLSYYGRQPLQAGETWRMQVRLFASSQDRSGIGRTGDLNPAVANRIWGRGYIKNLQGKLASCSDGVCAMRGALSKWLHAKLSSASASLLVGILLGEPGSLSPDLRAAMRKAGLGHLMAVSGLHVGAVFSLAFVLIFPLARLAGHDLRGTRQSLVLALSVLLAWSYVCLSGWSISAVRAASMLSIGAFVALNWRVVESTDVWLLCLAFIALFDPVAIGSPSLWLSFWAVLLILLGLKRTRGKSSVQRWIRLQNFLFFGMAPIMLHLFNWFALSSWLLNLVIVPLFGLLFFPVVCATLLLDVMFSNAWLWQVLDYGLQQLLDVAMLFENTAMAVALPPAVAALAVLLVVLGIAPKPLGSAPLAFALAIVVGGVWLFSPWLRPWGARLWLLDTGQSLASVFEVGNRLLVYDVGRSGSPMARFLAERPLSRKWLVVSHSDLDHSGGLQADFPWERMEMLYTGQPAKLQKQHKWDWRLCNRGATIWSGRIAAEVLWPDPAYSIASDNDRSCVVQIRIGEDDVLLTGDITARVERRLLASGPLERLAVLVVPHHGSKYSSSREFLQKTKPRYAVIAAAHRNPWGFPREETLTRLREVGSHVWWTGKNGAIVCEWNRNLIFNGCAPHPAP